MQIKELEWKEITDRSDLIIHQAETLLGTFEINPMFRSRYTIFYHNAKGETQDLKEMEDLRTTSLWEAKMFCKNFFNTLVISLIEVEVPE